MPRDTEFEPNEHADIFADEGLPLGMCFGSKSGYRRACRVHFFVPNANVFCHPHGKVWWGDLDLWRHTRQLERVAVRLHCRLYVLQEMDGRFQKAELPFDEVSRNALWHTGGPVRPRRRLLRNSGLSLSQLAILTGVSRQRLVARQNPYFAQQINRHLTNIEKAVGPFTRHDGFKKWGHWFLAPNSLLNDRSPFDVVRAGEAIALDKLFPEVFANVRLLDRFAPALLAGTMVTMGGGVSFHWPLRERQR